jgi:hypothetical protein
MRVNRTAVRTKVADAAYTHRLVVAQQFQADDGTWTNDGSSEMNAPTKNYTRGGLVDDQ